MVLEIVSQVIPPSAEYSQFKIFPAYPLNVNAPLLLPLQRAVLPETDPPTVAGSTVIVAVDEFACEQVPLCTTAQYKVVAVRLR